MTTFKNGQTVYDRSGGKHLFEEALSNDRALVRTLFVTETYDGGTEEWPADAGTILPLSKLSCKPPVALLAAEVAAERAKLDAVRKELSEAQRDLREQEADRDRRLKALAQHPKLARLEDFLAGRFTHFALKRSFGSSVTVKTLDEALASNDDYARREKDIKLLVLFGMSNGNLEWRINDYRDGSGGGWTVCQPCISREAAVETAIAWLEADWDAYRASPQQPHLLGDSIKSAEALGLEVPDDIREAHQASLLRTAQSKLDNAERALASARDEMIAATKRPVRAEERIDG